MKDIRIDINYLDALVVIETGSQIIEIPDVDRVIINDRIVYNRRYYENPTDRDKELA